LPERGGFPRVDISTKLAIAIGIGMLVGLEREWSQKDLGTRTFAIAAIAGTLGILTGAPIAYLTFAGILLIILLTGLRNIHDGETVETTTAAALIATHDNLLALKPALTHFAGGLKVNEVRSAVLPGLLAFVIYPVLPDRTIAPFSAHQSTRSMADGCGHRGSWLCQLRASQAV
jgi:hypothetical protein